jgi:hypothetical protein
MTRILQKTLSGLAIVASLTGSTLFASGDAVAFKNTIHPIISPTVRDHRGPNGASQGGVTVTITCSKATYPNCGGHGRR